LQPAVWALRELIRKEKGVVGDVGVQVGRLRLNHHPMLAQDHGNLRDGLAAATA
jgi:hypothetical protein